MNEFSIIDTYFKSLTPPRDDVILGVGDDAACLKVPSGFNLIVTCDTLVSDVHFHSDWKPYDIAYKAVMVNVSDIAAMAAIPCWASLALTMPDCDPQWLDNFSHGLQDALTACHIQLIGGDITRGPLVITITLHGTVPEGLEIRRSGAHAGDQIFVSGELGAAALAVKLLGNEKVNPQVKSQLMQVLKYPQPRVDYANCLRQYATAAIDISDGLSADLQHICRASRLGACLDLDKIPMHHLVSEFYDRNAAIDLALSGGDDYQLCFTVPKEKYSVFMETLHDMNLQAYCIGVMEEQSGLRVKSSNGKPVEYQAKGYSHF